MQFVFVISLLILCSIGNVYCAITYCSNGNVTNCGTMMTLTSKLDTFDTFTTKICDVMKKSRSITDEEIGFHPYRKSGQYNDYKLLMYGLETLMIKSRAVKGRKKMFLEFGVASGFSVNVTASMADSNTGVYGFDWFFGLPETWAAGGIRKGAFGQEGGKMPKVLPNVKLINGLFNATLNKFLMRHRGTVDFLNVDNDLYEGALYILGRVLPRMTRGSIIHFHELLRWTLTGECGKNDELMALYNVMDLFPGLRLELIVLQSSMTKDSKESVLFRFIGL
jgi:hypothetical protein